MKLLIPGGAGYIGSHMVRLAQENNFEVTVIDNLSTGHKWALSDCEFIECDLLDKDKLAKCLNRRHFDGVIHFAAKSLVAESVINPLKYYKNNFVGSLNLINELIKNDVTNLVFSSSAAIYGNPKKGKISEDDEVNPINPYGSSKLMVERLLNDVCSSLSFSSVSLRYFNAAGAHISSKIGELHDPETHLIPNILNSVLNKNNLTIFGNDYLTRDGTCIRDYIHVSDLADAHLKALHKIMNKGIYTSYNLGNGEGFSVLEIINSCEKITKSKINFKYDKRRPGDPAILIADNSKSIEELNWDPKFKNIDEIILTAWEWAKESVKYT